MALALVAGACTGSSRHPGAEGAPASTSPGRPSTAVTTTTVATTTALATTTTSSCTDLSVIESWSVARRAAQLLVVPILDANPAAVQVATSAQAGGMLLLGSAPPASSLAAATRPAVADHIFVMTDEEGGGVQRLVPDVESLPWARQMAASLTPAAVGQLAQRLGHQMIGLGVGVDLAPVLDLDGGPSLSAKDPDGPRSFSTDPHTAATYGLAFAGGLAKAGVLAVAKHFPGLGGASGNTDYGPASTPPITQLDAQGLVPFEDAVAAGIKAVMISNATVPGLTAQPSSVSKAVITGLLEGRLHFGGLVLTDSLSAGALSAAGYSIASASSAAIEAGADMVLFGSTLTAADAAQLAPGPLAAETHAIIAALSQALGNGNLAKSRFDDAVLHVVEAKGVDLCG